MGEVIRYTAEDLFSPGVWPDAIRKFETLGCPVMTYDATILYPDLDATRVAGVETEHHRFDTFSTLTLNAIDRIFRRMRTEYHLQYTPDYDIRKLMVLDLTHDYGEKPPSAESINFQLEHLATFPGEREAANFTRVMDGFNMAVNLRSPS